MYIRYINSDNLSTFDLILKCIEIAKWHDLPVVSFDISQNHDIQVFSHSTLEIVRDYYGWRS